MLHYGGYVEYDYLYDMTYDDIPSFAGLILTPYPVQDNEIRQNAGGVMSRFSLLLVVSNCF